MRELEFEAKRRRRGRPIERHHYEDSSGSGSSHVKRALQRSSFRLSMDRSVMTRDKNQSSPRRDVEGHPNMAFDAMSQALMRISQSPFFEEIEKTEVPCHFTPFHSPTIMGKWILWSM